MREKYCGRIGPFSPALSCNLTLQRHVMKWEQTVISNETMKSSYRLFTAIRDYLRIGSAAPATRNGLRMFSQAHSDMPSDESWVVASSSYMSRHERRDVWEHIFHPFETPFWSVSFVYVTDGYDQVYLLKAVLMRLWHCFQRVQVAFSKSYVALENILLRSYLYL